MYSPRRLGAARQLQLGAVHTLDVLVHSYRLLLQGVLSRTEGAPADRRRATLCCTFCLQRARRLDSGSHFILPYA